MSAITDSMDVTSIERGPSTLEYMDYIPFVSMVSGVARAVFGIFQAAYGIVSYHWEKNARVLGNKSPFTFVEGIANIVRGIVAAHKPFVGNIALYLYDHSRILKPDIRRAAGLQM